MGCGFVVKDTTEDGEKKKRPSRTTAGRKTEYIRTVPTEKKKTKKR